MDKEGFNLIDQEFQKELKAKQLEITEKWEKSYSNKRYVGTSEIQQKAQEADNYQRKVKIKNEVNSYKEKLSERHFGDGGREAAAEKVREQEQKNSQELIAKQQEESQKRQIEQADHNRQLREQAENSTNQEKEKELETEQKKEKARQQIAKQREEFNRNAKRGFDNGRG